MGLVFAGGKFDLNKASALPLSAFSAAMSSLTRYVMVSDKLQAIQEDLRAALMDHDLVRLDDALPGCEDLFTFEGGNATSRTSNAAENGKRRPSFGGKEVIQRLRRSVSSRPSIAAKKDAKRLPSFGGQEAIQQQRVSLDIEQSQFVAAETSRRREEDDLVRLQFASDQLTLRS